MWASSGHNKKIVALEDWAKKTSCLALQSIGKLLMLVVFKSHSSGMEINFRVSIRNYFSLLISSLHSIYNMLDTMYFTHFTIQASSKVSTITDEETEAQRRRMTLPRSHSYSDPEFKPRCSGSRIFILNE